MKLTEPILTKRIPSIPHGDPKDRHIVGYDEFVKTDGYQALSKALDMQPAQVLGTVKDAILRGRGGAGFPAGLKWSFLPPQDGKGLRYLCVNCDEAEPGTFKDRLLVDFDPHLVLEGIAIACWACQLDVAYFFIRGEYHHQARVMERAIQEAYAAGIFGKQGMMAGKSKHAVECYVHRSAGAYICGEETGLLEAIEGKRGWPRVKPPFPAVKGLFGRPTIVNNVETLAAVPDIISRGVAWWKSIGVESSFGGMPSYGTKLMGVSGHVTRPGCFEAPLGIPLSELVNEYCGGMRGGKKFKGAIAGGVSMGVLGTDQFDAAMDFDIGRRCDVLGLGTACPTIFDEDTDMVAVARNCARFFMNESCGQCTPCREGSGWIHKLLTRIDRGDATTADLDLLVEIASSMGLNEGTTICGLADGNNWLVRTIVKKFRGEFERRVRPKFVPLHLTAR
ncbi:MAG: NADH-quinone oxidoreductase subunit NuoF [Phycisphaerales bacterium]|nr:NADH-quinone oxidoreductase subunit NuoF [Phycisphaerales bacterium]